MPTPGSPSSARQGHDRDDSGNDAYVAVDANVTNVEPAAEARDERPAAPTDTEAVWPAAEPETAATAPAGEQPSAGPRSLEIRKHAGEAGLIAVRALAGITGFVVGAARFAGRVVRQVWRAVEAVPPALQLFFVVSAVALSGVVGAIALRSPLGLICIVMVVPVCSGILGALGYRWYSGVDGGARQPAQPRIPEPAAPELRRAVEYVDRKLESALSSFGTEQHQQAVIALFQAKTAVELTLGTEQDTAGYAGVALPVGNRDPRPRIRTGSGSTAALRESNSLVAS